jgi:hypothetical protein
LAKLRLAAIRNEETAMAQKTLFDLGPAQDVVVESARALALSGDRPHARQLLVGVAHDQARPPSIRADAYYLRDYELKGIGIVVSHVDPSSSPRNVET